MKTKNSKLSIRGFFKGGALVMGVLLWGGLAHAQQTAIVGSVAADFTSGAHAVIGPVSDPSLIADNVLPTVSDITVAAEGDFFYRIERFSGENITKFSTASPSTVVWQYSTADPSDIASSNPRDLVFINANEGYVLRYGSTTAWQVNLAATSQASFKTGELDLSPYADQDGLPEMDGGVVVDGKLFVTLQRLNRNAGWCPTNTSYVAVFDTATNTEIDTGIANPDGVMGIPLPIRNPEKIVYVEGDIYVFGAGSLFGTCAAEDTYTSGVVKIDPETYLTGFIFDDGTAASHPHGLISDGDIVSRTKGYFVGYDGFGDNTLYAFNPTLWGLSDPIPVAPDVLSNKNLAALAVDENGRLWVSNATDAEVVIIDSADNSVFDSFSTNLNPDRIVFTPATTIPDANLTAPVLAVQTAGNTVTLSWDTDPDADGYILYFAPFDLSFISSFNFPQIPGPSQQSISFTVHAGDDVAAYFLMQSRSSGGFSELSNLIAFENP